MIPPPITFVVHNQHSNGGGGGGGHTDKVRSRTDCASLWRILYWTGAAVRHNKKKAVTCICILYHNRKKDLNVLLTNLYYCGSRRSLIGRNVT